MLKKNKILFICLMSLMSLFLLLSAFQLHKDEPTHAIKIIVIDPGHGGKDPGCNGVEHNEKTVALSVALKLGKLIEENIKDVKVIYTRTTDVFVELEDRAKIANDNKADLFISIHCNAAGKPVLIKDKKTGKMRAKTFKNKRGKTVVVETANPVPYGSETYVMGLKNEQGKMQVAQRENSAILLEDNYEKKYEGFDPDSEESYIIMSNYTSAYVINSAKLAMNIQDEYATKAGRVDKGVHRQSIWVLWRTAMPSILTEIGYLTNPDEEKFLGSEKGQTYMASCLFRAFRKYKDDQEGNKKKYNDELENQKSLEKEVYTVIKEDKDLSTDSSEEVVTPTITVNKADSVKLDLEKAKLENEKRYKKFIALGDLNFKKKNYEEALNLYELAEKFQPDNDSYALNKVIEIKTILEKEKILKSQKEKDKQRKDSLAALKPIVTETVVVKQKIVEKEISTPTGVTFKVQFAGLDKEVDTKTKFPNVENVSFYQVGAVYKYTSGNYATVDEAAQQQTKLRTLGYKDCFVVAFKNGVRMSMSELKK